MGSQSITLLTFIIYEDNPEIEITYYSHVPVRCVLKLSMYPI